MEHLFPLSKSKNSNVNKINIVIPLSNHSSKKSCDCAYSDEKFFFKCAKIPANIQHFTSQINYSMEK